MDKMGNGRVQYFIRLIPRKSILYLILRLLFCSFSLIPSNQLMRFLSIKVNVQAKEAVLLRLKSFSIALRFIFCSTNECGGLSIFSFWNILVAHFVHISAAAYIFPICMK